MQIKTLKRFCIVFFLIIFITGLGKVAAHIPFPETSSQNPKITIVKTNYQGWQNSWVLSNGQIEVVVAPQIGRIMQFRFKGEENLFWTNRKLDGRLPNPRSREWSNFGGDKAWPAPQSNWKQVTGREWPPPAGFDAVPMKIEVKRTGVKLISPIDPFYGIQTDRLIQIDPKKAIMTISTTYRKVKGTPKEIAVWTVTQLRDPIAVYAALPTISIFPQGYIPLSDELPTNLTVKDQLISLTRSGTTGHKIGCDASTLLWIGNKTMMRIDAPRITGAHYPDQGSSAEIFTNPDPDAYVELEFLSPLKNLQVGENIHFTTTYTLMHRSLASFEQEARKILQRSSQRN